MKLLTSIVISCALFAGLVLSCADDDAFTTSTTATLSFSTDSVKMDTVFSTVGSRTYDFWVYNHSSRGVRLQSVRLRQGNQTGFRVNVDGSYLDNELGAVVNGLEVRKGDSLRVFVEFTAPRNEQLTPQMVQTMQTIAIASTVVTVVCIERPSVCEIDILTISSSEYFLPWIFLFSRIRS